MKEGSFSDIIKLSLSCHYETFGAGLSIFAEATVLYEYDYELFSLMLFLTWIDNSKSRSRSHWSH